MPDPAFVRRLPDGVLIELKVRPRARRTALALSGPGVLEAAVSAPPADGKANAAVIGVLAEAWRLPRSAFAIARGASARNKVVAVAGDPGLVVERVNAWLERQCRT